MSKDYMDAEDSIDESIWKLETIADMLSVMSDMERIELRQASFYGISLIIQQEADGLKKETATLMEHIHGRSGFPAIPAKEAVK
jgi:hypothetical protein